MKKPKNLSKKIQRLKARLAKDAKKLAKLTMKLGAAVTPGRGKRKSVARTRRARTHIKVSPPTRKKNPVSKQKVSAKSGTAAKGAGKPSRPKRKLNLTPERRAQLADAMKARWAAKRAAAASSSA